MSTSDDSSEFEGTAPWEAGEDEPNESTHACSERPALVHRWSMDGSGPPRPRLRDFSDVWTLEQDAFSRAFPHAALISLPNGLQASSNADTGVAEVGDVVRSVRDLTTLNAEERGDVEIFTLRKKPTNAGEAIWIGRSMQCDLVFNLATVSKLHALVTYGLDGRFLIGDSGSKNGTFVNGAPLERGVMCPLSDTDLISIGSLDLRFFLPRSLFSALRALKPA